MSEKVWFVWKLSRQSGQGSILAVGQKETEHYMKGENMERFLETKKNQITFRYTSELIWFSPIMLEK